MNIDDICVCWGSMTCGKSLNSKRMIYKYVHDGIFPSWVLEIYDFLQGLGLKFFITSNENDVRFDILNVPLNLRDIVLEKTSELNLLFHIHKKETAIFSGHPLYNPHENKKIVGFQNNGINFEIKEPKNNENTNKIYYTLERKY